MKIAVIGMGYVGLGNAVLLAQKNDVYCVDVLPEKIAMLNNKQSPINDTDIINYLKNNNLSLIATQDLALASFKADYIIIAVPTNYDPDKNYFDTSIIEQVISDILKINTTATLIIKSTVPIGYTEILINKTGYKNIIFSPEFLREGKALYDNLHPSRIIVGYDKANELLNTTVPAYINIIKDCASEIKVPVIYTSSKEAEAIKLFSNTYLALRIAFFNEVDTFAEVLGLDSKNIIIGMSYDPRIGMYYNNPSFGYGGYCLPKDTKQLLAEYGSIPQNLIKAAVESNNTRIDYIITQIINKINNIGAENCVLGIYRLTMKTGSDNFRESAAQKLINKLLRYNIKIVIYEPNMGANNYAGIPIEHSLENFKQKATIIVANRFDNNLTDVIDKVYTRDIFNNN